MVPDPLHPAVVHFPIALVVLAPLVALAAFLAIERGWMPPRTWLAVVALQALLVGSTWLAVETGEAQEDRVEQAVSESVLEGHEEGAERFLELTLGGLAVAGLGLLRGRAGTAGRAGALAATLGLLVAGAAVGHSGGELVYRHGAAQVYVDAAPPPEGLAAAGDGRAAERASAHAELDDD